MSKRIVLFSSVALVLATVACGGPSPAQDAESTKHLGGGTGPVQASRRSASDAIKKAWPADALDIVVYVDVGGLVRTKLVSDIVAALLPMVSESWSPEEKACEEEAVKSTRELAIASVAGGGDVLVVGRYEPAAASKIAACVRAASGFQPVAMNGASDAWSNGKDVFVAVTKSGLLFSGSRALVENALAGRGNGKTLEAVSLEADEFVAWNLSLAAGAPPIRGSVLVTDDRFRIAGQGDAPDETIAERIEGAKPVFASALLGDKLPPEQRATVKRLVDAVAIKRTGRHLEARFELHGPTEQIAADIGTGATIGVYAVRQYLLRAKQAEATHTIGRLSLGLSREWKAAGPGAAKMKLVSYPPTPKTVPKGERYQTSSADWKPWTPLAFEMTEPQYYQYEIKAAKDGKSADIIARGDLNGDGVTSEFKLTVKVGAGGKLEIPPTIAETNPDE